MCSAFPSSFGEFALAETQYRAYLPTLFQSFPPATEIARITNIQLASGKYQVYFQTYNYTPQMPGLHVHFFFNTVPPGEAGLPGSGPWYVYAGASPFSGYGVADRPAGATQLCVLVANANHSIRLNTGNCVDLP